MPARNSETALDYRSPITPAAPAVVTSRDEADQTTLKMMYDILDDAVTGLYKEFNAFDVLKEGTTEAIKDEMMRKIAGNQIAFDIMSPVMERIQSVLAGIDEEFNKRNK